MSAQQSYVRVNYTTGLVLDYVQTASGVWGTAYYMEDGVRITPNSPTVVADDVYRLECTATDLLRPMYGHYLESIGV